MDILNLKPRADTRKSYTAIPVPSSALTASVPESSRTAIAGSFVRVVHPLVPGRASGRSL
jgi:hypothetical protein